MAKRKVKVVPAVMGFGEKKFMFHTTDPVGKAVVVPVMGKTPFEATKRFAAIYGPRTVFTKMEAV